MLKTKTRESNIELLRVVTMLLIVMYHIVYHAVQGAARRKLFVS